VIQTDITATPGDALSLVLEVDQDGTLDFTGWTIDCDIKQFNGTVVGDVLATGVAQWIDAAQGMARILVPAVTTAAWPEVARAVADVVLTRPDGVPQRTDKFVFNIVWGVTS
jgi:hypothetical protein